MIGSPTRDKAQCRGERPSDSRSCVTPAERRKNIITHELDVRGDRT